MGLGWKLMDLRLAPRHHPSHHPDTPWCTAQAQTGAEPIPAPPPTTTTTTAAAKVWPLGPLGYTWKGASACKSEWTLKDDEDEAAKEEE